MSRIELWNDLPGYEGVFAVSSLGRTRALGRRPDTHKWDVLDGEIWKAVPGYEGIYEVSDHGRVKGLERIDGRGHWKSESLRIPALTGPKGKQYLGLELSNNGTVTRWKIHRLVLWTFVGPCPEGMEGCHNNGDKLDNRLVNLRWDTSSENNRDKRDHGTDHQIRKTHCPYGHEYTEENTYGGVEATQRRCKTCARDRARNQGTPKIPKTHCRRGHALTPDNVQMSGDARKCRTCAQTRRHARQSIAKVRRQTV